MHSKLSCQKRSSKSMAELNQFLEQHNLPDLIFIQGFIAAIVSSPSLILPEEWMGHLGFEDRVFQSMKQHDIDHVITSVLSIYDHVYVQFENGEFELPLPKQSSLEQRKRWARGYMEVVGWDCDAWFSGEVAQLIFPILSLALPPEKLQTFIHDNGIPTGVVKKISQDQKILSLSARAIYEHWLTCPIELQPHDIKIGRNDPCPCDSGKKYKKCCLVTDQVIYH